MTGFGFVALAARWRRWSAAALAAVGLTLLTPSWAVAEPVPATLTQLAFDGTTLEGVLTLRATSGDVTVDPASLSVTIAGNTTPATVSSATSLRRAVFLVVDTSGSMDGNSGMPIIKSAVAEFLDRVPADVEVGLISFANVAGVDVEPTTDRAAVRSATTKLVASGETALYDAVTLAVARHGPAGERSIVVLSDGVNTVGRKDLAPVLDSIRAAGVRLDSIGLRTKTTADTVLTRLAEAGGGTFAQASDQAAVTRAFSAAAKALDRQVTWSARPGALPAGNVAVEVRGVAGGSPFVASGTITVSLNPTAPPTATTAVATAPVIAAAAPPTQQLPTWLLIAGVAGTFLGLLALSATALAPAFRTARQERVQSLEAYAGRPAPAPVRRDSSSVITANLVGLGERVMAGRESTSRTMALLQRADLAWRPGEWAVLRLVALVLGVIIGMVLFRDGALAVFGVVVGAIFGLVFPAVLLRALAKRRAGRFERQMPDILMLVASSLSTGFSLPQALDAVARDVAEPASKEFARVMAETRIGADVEDAIERMALRMDSDNMRWTAMAIRIQRQVGGNLAETLRTTAATLREREYLHRHVRALSAEGRLSGYILVALPIALFIYEVNVNRAYISLLWTTTLGWIMIGGSLLLMTIGIIWMTKAIKVEV